MIRSMFWRARLLSGREGAPPALRISSATLASDSVGRARTVPLSFPFIDSVFFSFLVSLAV
jgi:hypothetical protein